MNPTLLFCFLLPCIGLSAPAQEAPPPALPPAAFPLRVSGNGRHLVDADGRPFLVVGDAAWSLVAQLNEANIARYLDDRQTRGFNSIIVNLLEHKFASKAPANIAGIAPFLKPGDFMQPNPAYFEYAHQALVAAEQRGLAVWLCPAYLGWGGGDEGFFSEIKAAGPAALRSYGRFVGQQFRDLANIVWIIGGDYALPGTERWAGNELALGLREGGANQLMTAHGGQTSALDTFGDQPWLAVDSAYRYQPDLWRPLLAVYGRKPARPFVLIETVYEGEHDSKPEQIRRQAWWAMLCGACGQFFGNNPMWHFDGPTLFPHTNTWEQALASTGSRDVARLGRLLATLPWHQLVPDTEAKLVASGAGDGAARITAARTLDGSLAALYIPADGTGPREFKLDLSVFPGPVMARWFNPAKDAPLLPSGAALPGPGQRTLQTPGDNGAGANDWLLVLESHPQTAADTSPMRPTAPAEPLFDKNSPYYFDGTISRKTLENYLDRSVTMGYFLVPGKPEGYEFPYRDDDVRLIRNIGAKFIGRALYRWGEESRLNDPAFLAYAKERVDTVHASDPEVIFQGCLFEQVGADVNNLKIPAWVFTDFGLPVEDRTFSCDAIIKREGGPSNRPGRRGGVPMINNLETQLWFYYLAVSYINAGCEALHLGQVGLIGAEDRELKAYSEFLAKVRAYAKTHARRHLVLMDGHVPSGGMVKDGVSLLDFNSFPLRIKAVPEKPYEAVLEVNHLDALFKRSKGCTSPSGWRCDGLPYLVEFDNYGRARTPNVADNNTIFVWGWDEISWFALQPEDYRNNWLRYAYNWIRQTDPNGHLQMPVTRMISCPNQTLRTYFANTKSPACPVGYSQEETIKSLWNREPEPVVHEAGASSAHYVFVPQDYGMPLTNVADVAVDSKNNLFTIVRGETPILVFNSQGKFLYGWGKGMIAGPHGIYIDSNDNVFCVDTKDHVVSKFTTDGKLLMTLGLKGVPSDSGSVKGNFKTVRKGAGPFNVPTKVATSKSGDIFVSDGYGNARVHRFSADGRLIKSWGEPGTGPGQFNLPHGIAVDDSDNVYVADRENDRIQVFDVDGNLKSIWTNISRPSAICIHKGRVYVTELGHRMYVDNVLFTPDGKGPWSRVRIFDVAGVEQASFGGPEGWKPGNFFAPHGICVDKEGAIYVAEVVWPAKESPPPKDLHPALQKFKPAD